MKTTTPTYSQLVQFHPTLDQWNEMFNALFNMVGMNVKVEKDPDNLEEYKHEGDSILITFLQKGKNIFQLNANLDVFQPELGVSIIHPKGSKAPFYQEGFRLWALHTTGGGRWHPAEQEDVTIVYHQNPAVIVKSAFDLVIEHTTQDWYLASKTLSDIEEQERLDQEIEFSKIQSMRKEDYEEPPRDLHGPWRLDP